MIIAVLANGAWDSEWGKQALEKADYLICADGGANHALSLGFMPDRLIGDLDSILPEYLLQCQEADCLIERYPREKDETDLELALLQAQKKAMLEGERDIWLYGGTGKRIDHFLGNLSLMLAYAHQGYRIRLADPWHEMWVFHGNEKIRTFQGQELSLIALSEKAVVSTRGLYYPLDHGVLRQDIPRGVSNVCLGEEVGIEVHEGWVLLILLKDGRV
ncbi:thiamine diphosphokinase [Desulfosporosinus sp. PR]|uniref:thiamine diphosphokinase n=1 Tax=Candidatus Desulfosporosinus nitrosoreducens TaxID=3401928 RepID=UPI0027E7AED7|nr:thiamine diphosphokinase [Desulfosporosinus sp. PR]MDQ7094756.1 thiamine diphosphokinase [Desulfosporosinus sp. PR]